MEVSARVILTLGAALIVFGAAAVVQAVLMYGFYPQGCGMIAPNGYCPDSLGSSGEFIGGIFLAIVGAGVSFYGFIQLD